MSTEKIDPHLTAMIVRSYVRHHRVGTDQISDLITSVHQAFGQLGQPVAPEEVLVPAVSVRRSVHQDYVVCLDCGYRAKMLRRHISTSHGLNRDEYLKRWGLRSDHPLTAPAYSERRDNTTEIANATAIHAKCSCSRSRVNSCDLKYTISDPAVMPNIAMLMAKNAM